MTVNAPRMPLEPSSASNDFPRQNCYDILSDD